MLLHWFITYNNTGHDEGSFDQDYAIKVYVKSFICLLRSLSLPWLSCNLPIRVIYERPKVEKLQSMTDCGVNIWPGDMTLQRPEIISNNLCSALPRLINLMELKMILSCSGNNFSWLKMTNFYQNQSQIDSTVWGRELVVDFSAPWIFHTKIVKIKLWLLYCRFMLNLIQTNFKTMLNMSVSHNSCKLHNFTTTSPFIILS